MRSGSGSGQASPLFSFLFFSRSPWQLGSFSSWFFVLSRGRVVPELSGSRHSKLDDLIMHHLRDRHFVEATLRRLSTQLPLLSALLCSGLTIDKLAPTRGTCFSLTHARICLFATGHYVLATASTSISTRSITRASSY